MGSLAWIMGLRGNLVTRMIIRMRQQDQSQGRRCDDRLESGLWLKECGQPLRARKGTEIDASLLEALQSMEFSRPESWSGEPFLLLGIFPTQGSNPGLPCFRQILYQLSHKGSPGILEQSIPSPVDLSGPGIEPGSPALQVDSLPTELSGKQEYGEYYSSWNYIGQNTGVGSLSLLQEIFPIWESNPGLPHCRQILCQMSHKGSARRNATLSETILDSTTEV